MLAAVYAIESTERGKRMNAVIPNLSRSKTISKNTGNTQWQEKKKEKYHPIADRLTHDYRRESTRTVIHDKHRNTEKGKGKKKFMSKAS